MIPLESVPYRTFLNVLSVLLWIPAWLVRLAFILVGLVVVPFTNRETSIWGNYEDPEPPHWFKPYSSEFVRDYLWRAIRNPANNLRFLIKQPAFFDSTAGRDNPHYDIYTTGLHLTSWRWTRSGLFSEFWYMKEVGEKVIEVRLGWKFSPVPGFMITAQVRYGE